MPLMANGHLVTIQPKPQPIIRAMPLMAQHALTSVRVILKQLDLHLAKLSKRKFV